jgi:hypothetical protein
MSWAAPPPYPPRPRSRSRSPYRAAPAGAYPPAGRPPYPGEYGGDYRGDWEAYERDRAWASYERERAALEYGRRPRSRSPGVDDGTPPSRRAPCAPRGQKKIDTPAPAGRKRRRSMSPYDTRFEPRPRFDDYGTCKNSRPPRTSRPRMYRRLPSLRAFPPTWRLLACAARPAHVRQPGVAEAVRGLVPVLLPAAGVRGGQRGQAGGAGGRRRLQAPQRPQDQVGEVQKGVRCHPGPAPSCLQCTCSTRTDGGFFF